MKCSLFLVMFFYWITLTVSFKIIPSYSFQYSVQDDQRNFNFGHHEQSDREGVVTGGYHIHLPDGSLQQVSYSVLGPTRAKHIKKKLEFPKITSRLGKKKKSCSYVKKQLSCKWRWVGTSSLSAGPRLIIGRVLLLEFDNRQKYIISLVWFLPKIVV